MRATLLVLALAAAASASSVLDLTPDTFDDIVNGERAVMVEFFAPWCGHCKNLVPVYDQVGDAYSHIKDVVVAKVDADEHKSLGSRFGVSGFPTIKFFAKGSTTGEDYNGGRSAEDFIKFLNEKTGAQGRLKVVPSDVVVLDDNNFDRIVMDKTKDVLVEFYAPWCGHCKSLAPIYEKVGTDFRSDKDVIVAKMDADHYRTVPGRYNVNGFPTLKWFPKDNKAGEDYNGGRTEADFVSFINEKTGTKRTVGGGLTEDAGLVAELDALATGFAASSDRQATLAKARELANGHASEYASYYVKVMEKIHGGASDYAATERARLQRVLDGGNVNADKKDSFTIRKNILSKFA